MKTFFQKTILACSVAAASLFAASAANADVFNSFTISHQEGLAAAKVFSADKITGGYDEYITFDNVGNFDVSLIWNAGQFFTNGGSVLVKKTGLTSTGEGDYAMYATYRAKGTTTVDLLTGKTTFTFTPGTGSLKLFLDEMADTEVSSPPATGAGPFLFSNTGDDVVLAVGTPIGGKGNLDPAGCGNVLGINCGSFGSTTSFALTNPYGEAFFISPRPFFDLSFQSGQLNNFKPTGNVHINGSLDVVLQRAEVPEPSSTALLGLGLLAIGFTARRRKQS